MFNQHSLFNKNDKTLPVNEFNEVNPHLVGEHCFFSAIEAAKILFRHDKQIPQISPTNVEQLDHKKADVCANILKECRQDKKNFDDQGKFLAYLNKLPSGAIIVLENSEGDHAFNIYKRKMDDIWIIDSDRQTYFKVANQDDFIHLIPSWDPNHERKAFNYFNCSFAENNESNTHLKAYLMSDAILSQNWEKNIYLNPKDESKVSSTSTSSIKFSYGSDDDD